MRPKNKPCRNSAIEVVFTGLLSNPSPDWIQDVAGFNTSLVPIRLDRIPSHTASLVTCLTAPNLQFSFERDTIGNAGHFFKHHAKRFLHRQPHDLSFWNNYEIRRNSTTVY